MHWPEEVQEISRATVVALAVASALTAELLPILPHHWQFLSLFLGILNSNDMLITIFHATIYTRRSAVMKRTV